MPLWGQTNTVASMPTWISNTNSMDSNHGANTTNCILVSYEESLLLENQNRGINSPGWWLVIPKEKPDGKMTYKCQLLVAMTVAEAVTGNSANLVVVGDVQSVITINTQPSSQTTVSGAATFTVNASASTGNVLYQWQLAPAANVLAFANVSGANAANLALTGLANTANGNQYRVVLNSTQGADLVYSNPVTLTFGT